MTPLSSFDLVDLVVRIVRAKVVCAIPRASSQR
jgi:hypothetical protein